MKKIVNNKIAIVLLIAITLFACNKDFLEETNPNEISTDSFWKSVDDLTLGVNAVYNAFKDGSILSIPEETVRADLAYPGYGRPNTTNPYYLKTFNDASDAVNKKWQALYKGIFRANQVIEACDRLIGTFGSAQEEKDALLILAQARFFRGLFYFYLHNSFNEGAVPIFDFVPVSETDFYQPISSAETVRNFYIADLEFAKDKLPITWELPTDQGRVTAGAATAVLGKSYLYAKDYETAKIYFNSVINDFGYSLTPNVGSNFTTTDELNSESILEINYSLNYKAEINPYAPEQTSSLLNFAFASAQTGGYRSVYPACWLIMEYKNEKLDYSDARNLITEEDGTVRLRDYSLRTSYSIALVDDRDLEYYGEIAPAHKTLFNGKETAYWRKFTNWDITDNEKNISQATPRSGVNVRVIRLADVLLMYAECLIEGGTNDTGVDDALLAINKVRRRSAVQLLGLNDTGDYPTNDHDNKEYTAKSLMDHLMYIERPLELSAEGMAIRVIDLRRWGITKQRYEDLSLKRYNVENYEFINAENKKTTRWGAVLIETNEEDSHPDLNEFNQTVQNFNIAEHAYWPIPNSEVVANPNLYNNQ